MLNNFHLAAITRKRTQKDVLQIPLDDELQKKLSEKLWCQYNTFVDGIEEIDFDPIYQPEEHEHFCVYGYELPNWLVEKNSRTISFLEKVPRDETQMDIIKGIAAFAQNERDEELILFQNFMPSQVIHTGLALIPSEITYTKMKHPGLMVGRKLSAVYHTVERKLLFHSFYNVNIFLSLSDYFKEASEQDIREVLSHKRLAPENVDALAIDANQWFKKRFAILKCSGVLDNLMPLDIAWRSKEYGVPVRLSEDNERIVFPADKSAAKKLLQFLNDEIFRGPITGELYETNSKKKVDQ